MSDMLRGENFLDFDSLTREDLHDLLDVAVDLKEKRAVGIAETGLEGKTLALLFEKPSLRTRLAFEIGMKELGGNVIYLSPDEVGLGQREAVEDVARVVGSMCHGVVLRTFSQETMTRFANSCQPPVINGLTDKLHPCQTLADLLTVRDAFNELDEKIVCFIGDGNNIANSWMNAAFIASMGVHIACPEGYEPDRVIYKNAVDKGAHIKIFRNPMEAVKGVDIVYTNSWVSMGQEEEAEKRLIAFKNYRIDEKIMEAAGANAIIMHCMPAHYGQEISGKLSRSPRSRMFQQAENRLHTAKALLSLML